MYENWLGRDGKNTPVEELSDEHLKNIVKDLENKSLYSSLFEERENWRVIMLAEAIRRGMITTCLVPEQEPAETEFKVHDITHEFYREYDFAGRVYRISEPDKLYQRVDGTTHRVVDTDGVVHCVPAPGQNGCVLRWESRDPNKPVSF